MVQCYHTNHSTFILCCVRYQSATKLASAQHSCPQGLLRNVEPIAQLPRHVDQKQSTACAPFAAADHLRFLQNRRYMLPAVQPGTPHGQSPWHGVEGGRAPTVSMSV